jgi:branched-chain amino acid transport system permease protein
LWGAHLGTSGEPSTYDFSVSIIVLCIVIVGGMGNVSGVLLGALVMMGINSIVLEKLSSFMEEHDLVGQGGNVLANPVNWKFMIFGLALILMMRFKPEGLLPSRRVKMELHESE